MSLGWGLARWVEVLVCCKWRTSPGAERTQPTDQRRALSFCPLGFCLGYPSSGKGAKILSSLPFACWICEWILEMAQSTAPLSRLSFASKFVSSRKKQAREQEGKDSGSAGDRPFSTEDSVGQLSPCLPGVSRHPVRKACYKDFSPDPPW